MRGSEGENDADSAGFDDGREGLVVINPLGLRKPTDNPTGFIASKRAVRVILVPKNPLPADDGNTGGARDKSPSLILKKSLVLITHGAGPVWISKSSPVGAWERRDTTKISKEVEAA